MYMLYMYYLVVDLDLVLLVHYSMYVCIWRTKYLGSMFEAGGGCITDVKMRIAAARQRFGKM